MNKEEAIKYLKRKGKFDSNKYCEVNEKDLIEGDEKEIEKVMKRGKIYGDPVAEIQW